MNTGTFAIDHTRGGMSTLGSAELRIGVLGEVGAHLTILAGDGEEYGQYWLRADLVEHCIEYLHFSELDGRIIRDATWTVDDVDEGGWEPSNDAASLLLAFQAMVDVAEDLRIRPLTLGLEIDVFGSAADEELLVDWAPLWTPESRPT